VLSYLSSLWHLSLLSPEHLSCHFHLIACYQLLQNQIVELASVNTWAIIE
jgi:hypothetical protein